MPPANAASVGESGRPKYLGPLYQDEVAGWNRRLPAGINGARFMGIADEVAEMGGKAGFGGSDARPGCKFGHFAETLGAEKEAAPTKPWSGRPVPVGHQVMMPALNTVRDEATREREIGSCGLVPSIGTCYQIGLDKISTHAVPSAPAGLLATAR